VIAAVAGTAAVGVFAPTWLAEHTLASASASNNQA
jgi:hypothetical protein